MPLTPIAEQIRRRDFGTVRRGYDPPEVRAYLSSIARQVELLERELSSLRQEATSAAAKGEQVAEPVGTSGQATSAGDSYDALSKRFATLIEVADQEAEKILDDAKSAATRALDEARGDADRIRSDAQAKAEETRQEVAELLDRVKTASDRTLSGLAERRRALVAQLQEMRGRLVEVAEDLRVPIEEASRDDGDDKDLIGMSAEADAMVDPRHDDFWARREGPIQIPDLTLTDSDPEERDR